MPITGPSLWHATLHLREHLNHVLATTVTQARLVPVEPRAHVTRIEVTFRQGGQPIDACVTATSASRAGLVSNRPHRPVSRNTRDFPLDMVRADKYGAPQAGLLY